MKYFKRFAEDHSIKKNHFGGVIRFLDPIPHLVEQIEKDEILTLLQNILSGDSLRPISQQVFRHDPPFLHQDPYERGDDALKYQTQYISGDYQFTMTSQGDIPLLKRYEGEPGRILCVAVANEIQIRDFLSPPEVIRLIQMLDMIDHQRALMEYQNYANLWEKSKEGSSAVSEMSIELIEQWTNFSWLRLCPEDQQTFSDIFSPPQKDMIP